MTFVQGIDYGPRDGTLGISLHMSEGGDGLPEYLARHSGEDLHQWARRVNGVSCNVAILSTGKRVQMLDWAHASGNLNPDDRAGEYGYYGGHHLRDVLGSHWPDPNAWTVSAELAGRRADGPTDAQVRSTIEWGLEMRDMFATIRGATGHHDQSPKGCPGVSPNMKAIFAGLGGHGLFTTEEPMTEIDVQSATAVVLDIPQGTKILNLDGSPRLTAPAARKDVVSPFVSTSEGGTGLRAIVWTRADPAPDLLLAIFANAAVNVRPVVSKADCTQAVSDARAAEHELVRAAMIAAAEAL
jgi:hypothetical protein